MNILRRVALLLCLSSAMLTACDGESQPFEEAVEIRNLQITALSVTPPANSRDMIFLNTNERVQFGIQALQVSGNNLNLSGTGRQWFVSEASRAHAVIDANGLLTARTDGLVNVFVRVGDLDSTPYTLRVRNASLTAIQSIEGEASIERCLPQDYFALGRFSDETTRNLNAVEWSIGDTADARVVINPDATATLTGLNAEASTPLLLNASVGVINATPATITVRNTLSALNIAPSPARVDVDESQAFTATGTYNDQPATETMAAIGTRRVVITDSVDWSITSGTSNATVSNVSPTRGVVTGVAGGNAVLSASCGDLADVQTVVVSATNNNDDSDQLSFNTTDNPLRIAQGSAGFRLRVATGSEFTTANEVTDDVSWNVESLTTTTVPISLVEVGTNAGLIRPNANGDANVTASLNGQSITIRVSVGTP